MANIPADGVTPGSFINGVDSQLFGKKFEIQNCLAELKDDLSFKELTSIISKLTLENPTSDVLFKGKYLIFIVKNLFEWQNPIGLYFQTTLAVWAAKLKSSPESDISNVSDCSNSEVFGNPLSVNFDKLSLIQPESPLSSKLCLKGLNFNYDLYAIPEIISRKLLYMCMSFENKLKLPFVVASQDSRFKSLCFLGANTVKNKPFRLRITTQGLITCMESLPSMADLKENQLEGFVPGNHVKSSVSAQYDILGKNSLDDSNLVPVKDAHIILKCGWSKPQSVLEPLPPESVCVLHLKTILGDEESGACNKFKEIQFLKALHLSLESGEMSWMSDTSDVAVMDKVKNLLKDMGGNIFKDVKQEADFPENINSEHIEEAAYAERISLYFTDKLWLLLKDCSSFIELLEVMKYVYKVLSQSHVQIPRTCRNDMSTMSKDLNRMVEQTVCRPELTPNEAVKLLLEIGVEKLRKDYEYIFRALRVTPNEIDHFMKSELLSPDAITALEKLHSALELTLICLKCLKLPLNILREFVSSVLKHYASASEIDLDYVFKFHVRAIYVRSLLNNMRPTKWELSLVTSDNMLLKQNVHRFITTPTAEHINAPENYHPKQMLKGASYVYFMGTLVEDIYQ